MRTDEEKEMIEYLKNLVEKHGDKFRPNFYEKKDAGDGP